MISLGCEQVSGCRVRLQWRYAHSAALPRPAGFVLYGDNGTGKIDFAAALATVDFNGTGIYEYTTAPLAPGRCRFAVQTLDADGTPRAAYYPAQLDVTDRALKPPLVIGPLRQGGNLR